MASCGRRESSTTKTSGPPVFLTPSRADQPAVLIGWCTHGSNREADTVFGGHEKVLRQTVVGLLQGAQIAERENHDEATIYVLEGRVRLWAGELSWQARRGDLLIVPDARHSLIAVEDSAVLITIAKLS